jgi:hypothetical protein
MESAVDPLVDFKVGDIPTCYYIPNYISEAEENYLLKNVKTYIFLYLTS